jgi:hypothetical protein
MRKRSCIFFLAFGLFLSCRVAFGDFYVIPGGRGVGTEIKSLPYTITKSGLYYITKNLTSASTGITVNSDNVFLNLNGYTIKGPGTGGGYGIFAQDRYNISIVNGIVRDFGLSGILLSNSSQSDIRAPHRIKGIQASHNGQAGIVGWSSTVIDCTSNYNGWQGIFVDSGSVLNCTANKNGDVGIKVQSGTIVNCSANDNTTGIAAHSGTIASCIATNNDQQGIWLMNSTVVNSTSNYNGDDGIWVRSCTVANCTANYNSGNGIYGDGTSIVKNCNVRVNNKYGIDLDQNGQNFVFGNAASWNQSGQINNCSPNNNCNDNATW